MLTISDSEGQVSLMGAGDRTFQRYDGTLPNWYRVLTSAIMAIAGIAAAILTHNLLG
jgi:hypothetical protein